MSAHGGAGTGGPIKHITNVVVLLLLITLLYAATRAVPEMHGPAGTIAAIGFLLLAGTLASELGEPLGLPHLSGYIAAGVVAGPHVLNLVDHHAVEDLSSINNLALALIALAGGAQLRLEILKKGLRPLLVHTACQLSMVSTICAAVFLLARPLVPFASDLPFASAVGVAILWGTFSISRSSAATLGILSQTRATGPVARHTLAFVMSSDIIAIVLTACALTAVRPLITPGSSMSMRELEVLGRALLGSVSIGTTLGLALSLYLRLIGRQLILVFVALGFVATGASEYLRVEALLVFMVAGFVVMNLSRQGDKLIKSIEDAASVVFVIFFATAGAHLDVPALKLMWHVALLLTASRGLASWLAARAGSRVARDPPILQKWAVGGLVSQAGLALGLGLKMEAAFPSLGAGFRSLVVACVAVNEVVGPILFKTALDRARETAGGAASRGSRPSLSPEERRPTPPG